MGPICRCMNRLLLAGISLLLLTGCGSRPLESVRIEPEPKRLTLMAVGDILMHHDVKKAAELQGGFESLWVDVTPLFRDADLVFGNLETPVAPITGEAGKPYLFNAPASLPDALRRSGFHVLSTANNHAYDQGTLGLVETQSQLEAASLVSLGSGRDQSRAQTLHILERNGIRIAFLAWTDLLNRSLNQAGKGPWVSRLEEAQSLEAVRMARLQADAVVVSVHWGKEDQHVPSERQRLMAARLFELSLIHISEPTRPY